MSTSVQDHPAHADEPHSHDPASTDATREHTPAPASDSPAQVVTHQPPQQPSHQHEAAPIGEHAAPAHPVHAHEHPLKSPWGLQGELVSFDVWDTLVRRRCHPDEVKLQTAATLLVREAGVRPEFASTWALLQLRQRVEAAIGVRRQVLGLDDEYRIEEVLPEWIAAARGIETPDATAHTLGEELVDLEVAHEMRVTHADPLGIHLVRDAAASSQAAAIAPARQPIAVSDFYLGERHLRKIIANLCPDLPLGALVVSCDVGLNKRSGRLFHHVHQRFHASPAQHVHIGDSVHADVETSRRLGCRPVHFANPKLDAQRSAHQARFAHRAQGLHHDWQHLIESCARRSPDGAMRRAGLLGSSAQRELVHAGLRVAPLFVSFVLSVLEDAARMGLDRVYYFTREGEFFAQIHEAIRRAVAATSPDAKLWGRPIPRAQVLCVSRVATFLPSLREVTTREMMRVWNQYSTQSMGQLIATLGLSPVTFEGLLARHGLTLDEPITYPWGDSRVITLFEDRGFLRLIERARNDARTLLQRYLSEQGISPGDNVLCVDIGWRGTIQDNLAHLCPNTHFHGVYFGMQRTLNQQPPNASKRAFGPDMHTDEPTVACLLDEVAPIEMITNALGGSVIGYHMVGDIRDKHVQAIRKSNPREDAAFSAATQYLQAGVIDATADVVDWFQLRGTTTRECRPLAIDLLRRVLYHPPQALARAFFSLAHNETFGAGGYHDLSIKLPRRLRRRWRTDNASWRELRQILARSRWAHGLLALEGMNDAADRLTREIHASILAPAFTPETVAPATSRDSAAAHSASHDPDTIARARAELVWIGRARAWRVVQSVKNNAAYRALARARFGPDWERHTIDACSDPVEKLRRIKASRAYRAICAIQSSPLTRAMRSDDRPLLPR